MRPGRLTGRAQRSAQEAAQRNAKKKKPPPSLAKITQGPFHTAPVPGPPKASPPPRRAPERPPPSPRPKPHGDRDPRLPPGFRLPTEQEMAAARRRRTAQLAEQQAQRRRDIRPGILNAPRRGATLAPVFNSPGWLLGLAGNAGRETEHVLRGMPTAMYTLGNASVQDFIHGPGSPIFGDRPSRLLSDVGRPVGGYYKDRYATPFAEHGLLGGVKEIGHEFYDNPVTGTLDLLGAAAVGARGASITSGAARTGSLKQGFRESYYPKTSRTLDINGVKVDLPHGRAPISRWWQGIYDNYTQNHPGLLYKRVGTVKARQISLERDRAVGRQGTTISAVHRMSFNPVTNTKLRVRAYWESHLPPEVRGGQGLNVIRDDLERRLSRAGPEDRDFLRSRVNEIRAAIEAKPNAVYEDAMGGLGELTRQRERILEDVFGSDSEMFTNRRKLLSELLGIEGDPGVYMAHVGRPTRKGQVAIPRAPDSGVIQPVSKQGARLTQQNKLERYGSGRLLADPDIAVQTWLKAQSIKYAHNVKQFFTSVSEPIVEKPKPGWYVVNPEGKPIPQDWLDAELDDALVAPAVQKYVESYIGYDHDYNKMLHDAGGHPESLRQVPPELVHRFMRNLGGGARDARGAAGFAQSFDVVNGLVKTSLLYANPAYIPANLLGNLTFGALHQGVFLPHNLIRSAQVFAHDKPLWHMVMGEVGGRHGATASVAPEMVSGGRRVVQGIRRAERGIAEKVGALPDNWPRAAAWLHEAKKAGYKTRERQMLLLTDENLRTELNTVNQRANGAMVDFNRLVPWERDVLAKLFFVWTWVRGATAWVGHYAKEYPERAAAIAPPSAVADRDNTRQLGQLPSYIEGAIPQGVKDGIATVLPVQALSPTSTALGVGQSLAGLVTGHPKKGRELFGSVTPIVGAGVNIAKGEDKYGNKVGYRKSALKNLQDLSPAEKMTEDLARGPKGEGLYRDRSRWDIAGRRILRSYPTHIDLATAHKLAEEKSKGSAQSTYDRELKKLEEEKAKKLRGGVTPELVKKVWPLVVADLQWKKHLRELEDERRKKLGLKAREKLDYRERAKVLAVLASARYPDAAASIHDALAANLGSEAEAKAFYGQLKREATESLTSWRND